MIKQQEERHAPFVEGDLVSNWCTRKIVNAVFMDTKGEWRMLIDEYLWHSKGAKAEFCREVICNGWYKVA